jgi:hypothetical protein
MSIMTVAVCAGGAKKSGRTRRPLKVIFAEAGE